MWWLALAVMELSLRGGRTFRGNIHRERTLESYSRSYQQPLFSPSQFSHSSLLFPLKFLHLNITDRTPGFE
ncbi:hypothetical protein F4806DRAFT_51467 [Annulohypoxylon nitens]|nr:hypothetical protein F4806DRAFT_51467 [Annulohypoxylon nitens]